jgi:DNA primase
MNNELLLLAGLENILGRGIKKSKSNYAFHCPFCNHAKPKLEISMITDEKGENRFACWVCHTRGRTVKSLLRQLRIPPDQAYPILSLIKKGQRIDYEFDQIVELPKEFKPLAGSSSQSVIANKIKKYLYARGLTDYDFLKYNIGYCTSGEYSGRIIIPSYDSKNKLNFFVTRTYENAYSKYKNPSTSRDIIFFENMINWEYPLVIVEGVFDAMAVRRNAIPILGKSLSKNLIKSILSNSVKDIYVALDKDALKDALSISEKFLSMGKKVFMVDMEDKDPSEMGFEKITQKINQARELTTSDLIKYKLAI